MRNPDFVIVLFSMGLLPVVTLLWPCYFCKLVKRCPGDK